MSFAFLPLYTGDYLRDTRHLTPLKHGIYLLLLMHCWDQKGPLPLEEQEAAGIANCRSADEIDALRYVLKRFFTPTEYGWFQKRMDREIQRAEALSHRLSTAGAKGGRKRRSLERQGIEALAKPWLSQGQASAKPLLHTPTPTTTPTPTPRTTELPLSHFVDTGPSPPKNGAPPCPVEEIIDLWNSIVAAAGGQKALNLSKARREMIIRRWRDVAPESTSEGLAWFVDLFRNRIAPSKFMTGRQAGKDGRTYRIGIDVAMRSELQLDQIAEGKYA